MGWYVYILECNNWRYYVWSTNDIVRRYKEHCQWKSIYTRRIRPLKLIYVKEFEILDEARMFEKYIKKQKEKEYVVELINHDGDRGPVPAGRN